LRPCGSVDHPPPLIEHPCANSPFQCTILPDPRFFSYFGARSLSGQCLLRLRRRSCFPDCFLLSLVRWESSRLHLPPLRGSNLLASFSRYYLLPGCLEVDFFRWVFFLRSCQPSPSFFSTSSFMSLGIALLEGLLCQ